MDVKDIKPAIALQQVEFNGIKYDVIRYLGGGQVLLADSEGYTTAHLSDVKEVKKDVEKFVVGQKVAYDYPDGTREYTTVLGIQKKSDGKVILFTPCDGPTSMGSTEKYRTPLEKEGKEFYE